MSLRLQLVAFGLLTLVLPWAGLRYVREMEGALRSGLEQSLLASAGTVATARNMGMVIGLFPIVGIPLPLLSYGGSSLVTTWIIIGILLNIRMRKFMF